MFNTRKLVELEFKYDAVKGQYKKLFKEFVTLSEKYDIIISELDKLKAVPKTAELSTSERIAKEIQAVRERKAIESALDSEELSGGANEDLDVLTGSI